MPMKGTIFKGILLILFLGVGETAVYSQQQQRKDTLVVTRDGTGDYRNIQEAVEAVRAFMDYTVTIYIKNGTYKEKLVIPSWVKNVQLVGESAENTIITYDDHANINKMGTFRTYTVKVSGNDITFKDVHKLPFSGKSGHYLYRFGRGTALIYQLLHRRYYRLYLRTFHCTFRIL